MFRKIEHIGIAVKDLASANSLFAELSEAELLKVEEVASEGVRTSFFRIGETKIEFLESTRADSPIARFIERSGEGIHHIAFDVADVQSEITRLQGLGFTLIHTAPKDGADNKRIAFLHPKSTNGVLIELCEERVGE